MGILHRAIRALVAITLVASFLSCAARRPSAAQIAEIGKADAMLRAGCFRCLQDALAIYERLSSSPRAPEHVARSAFAAALLLTMRAKELGVPSEPFRARSRELAARIPPSSTSGFQSSVYLDAADYFVGDVSGLDPPVRQTRSRRPRSAGDSDTSIPEPVAALARLAPTDITAEYVRLAIQCEITRDRATLNARELRARHDDAPLIRFRLALCGLESAALPELRSEDSRWADTFFFEGQRELANRPVADVEKAAGFFAAAHDAFPDSNAITLALAHSRNSLSEYQSALRSFDRVLSAETTHRDALLGRVMSLSYLTRHTEAVATATRMIELGTWHIGDAYYWRAWNRYHLYALESAWTDVELATRLLVNTSVYTLAGFIAYARKELETAIDRFDRAFVIDKTNCEAVWTAGLVHVDQQDWTAAAPKFSRAMSCFVAAADEARADMETTQAATYAESIKARRIAAAQKRIATAQHRKAQAAFNAANSYLRLGRKSAALTHLDVAAEHALLREKADALRPTIEKLPQ